MNRGCWSTASLIWLVVATMPFTGKLRAQDPDIGPPPGRLIDVGGYRLHLDCRGSAHPTVVIDVGAWSIFFRHIQEQTAGEAQVCTYDRAGMGWSDPGPTPRTSERMAQELHTLLRRAGVPAPYVLVGHSLGGLNVRAFARQHPDEVAGLVLVESAHEDQWNRLPPEAYAALGNALPRLRAAAAAARAGQLAGRPQPGPFPQASKEVQATYSAAMTTPKPYEGFAAEIEGVMLDAKAPGAPPRLEGIPLAVVTAGNSFAAFEGSGIPREAANAVWMELQSELVRLSTTGRQFVSDTANHRIHASDPGIVARGIRHVLQAARASMKEPTSGTPVPRILPGRSTPEVDRLLRRIEETYAAMDVAAFVGLFTEDFIQDDVNRRVHVESRNAWTKQTEMINAAHRQMSRRHYGRLVIGEWVVAEIEWGGIVRGEAIGVPGRDREYLFSGLGLLKLKGGKVQRQVLYSDYATLMAQLPKQ